MEVPQSQIRRGVIQAFADTYGVNLATKNALLTLLDPVDNSDIMEAVFLQSDRYHIKPATAAKLLEQTISDESLLFIIDTDSYAGNFEREMGAFMTGEVGDSSLIGKEEQALFRVSVSGEPFKNTLKEDKDGQIYDILPTPGWFNNGFGAIFRDGQEAEAQAVFEKQQLSVTHSPTFSKEPAFLSVGMTFKKRPTAKQIELLKERARKYAASPTPSRCGKQHPPITITGFRAIPV